MHRFSLLPLLLSACFGCAYAAPATLTLPQAEQQLLRHNREVLAAQRAAEGAAAGVIIAGQAPNPTLSWSAASINPSTGVGSGGLRDKRVDQIVAVSQPIERGDKRELRVAAAEGQERAARDDVADMRRQQRLALHQAYFDLKAAHERAVLNDDAASLYAKSLEASRSRLQAGDVAAVDVSRLRIEVLRAQNDARAARAELARARRALAYLIGAESQADELAASDAWPDAMPPETLPPLERRADMRAAAARVEAAARARDLARSLRTRDVTVQAQVEHDLSGPGAGGGVTYGVALSVPLFARHGYEGEAARAESDYTAALEVREKTLALAQAEAARARSDLQAALDRLARIDTEVLPTAREVAAAAEFAYGKGAMGLLDLLDARRTLRAVELDAVAAHADHAKARAAWLAATAWETAAAP